MTTRVGSAPSSSKIRSWSSPTGDSTAWVVIARPVRRAARAAARWTRSSCADTHGLSVPISPMIPGRTPVSPTPVARLGDELVGEVIDRPPVDEGLRRVVRAAIPAAAHDDVEPARPGDARQPGRIAPDPGQGQVHEPAAAGGPVRRQLLEDQGLVARELPVVPAIGDLPQRDLGVLVRQREPELGGIDRTEDRLDVGHGPRCYAVAAAGCSTRAAASRTSRMARARRTDSSGR